MIIKTLTSLALLGGLMFADDAAKPKPPADTFKLTTSEMYSLQTITQRMNELESQLKQATQFRANLVTEMCSQPDRKIPVEKCEVSLVEGVIKRQPDVKAQPSK